jgi:ribosomal protein S18 acetylase RimI-like enzyme
MADHRIEFLDQLPADVDGKVQRGHVNDEAGHGIVCDYKPFSLVVRSAAGDAIGVLSAYTAFAEIYVDDIWVDPGHRGVGLGRELLTALESHYQNQGYNNINLVTSQFQAVGFYEKCGYEVEFVRTNKHHPKLTKTFFVKFFRGAPQTKGILD